MIILLAWLASSLVTYQNLNIKILYTQYGFVRDELRKTSPQPQQNQSNPSVGCGGTLGQWQGSGQ